MNEDAAGFYASPLLRVVRAVLYGPMIVIFILSFQARRRLTFPMNGCRCTGSTGSGGRRHRRYSRAFKRSLALGLVVMVLTVLLSLMAGLAFRKKFAGSNALFYVRWRV